MSTKNRNLTCIICPRGCDLCVSFSADGAVSDVVGNACPRGKAYAEKECTAPERTVTTTVKTADGGVLPCKTKCAVPKEKMFAVMEEVNRATAPASVKIGDVILENAAGTGVPVVATANRN